MGLGRRSRRQLHRSEGETLGLVAESAAQEHDRLSIMRLQNRRPAILGGQVLLEGEDLLTKSGARCAPSAAAGSDDPARPMQSPLNVSRSAPRSPKPANSPRLTGRTLWEQPRRLSRVRIRAPSAAARVAHQMSGGMPQRVGAITWPVAGSADRRRPTTSLDVTIQAHLRLIKSSRRDGARADLHHPRRRHRAKSATEWPDVPGRIEEEAPCAAGSPAATS